MAMLGARAASAAERVAGQMDKQGQCLGVPCLASSCHRPNALHLQERNALLCCGACWGRMDRRGQ